MSSTPSTTSTTVLASHPRRRFDHSPTQCLAQGSPSPLRKGATFAATKSPSSTDAPVLNIPTLPRRSVTSPRALQDLVAAGEKRALGLINQCLTDSAPSVTNALPVPTFMLANVPAALDALGLDDKVKDSDSKTIALAEPHRHTSDSGLGSSVVSSPTSRRILRLRTRTVAATAQPFANTQSETKGLSSSDNSALSNKSVYSGSTTITGAFNKSLATSTSIAGSHYLSEYATKQIQQHIIKPILQLETLKDFHPLIKDLPNRISDRNITCLRDLEKTLIFLAPVSADFSAGEGVLAYCFIRFKARSISSTSYLNFCETSIQCIHATVDHLNEIDQRRPTDRPYTNNYFVDLVEQVRQYARIMAAAREKMSKGEELTELDYTPGEKITLVGGASRDGKPLELVREKDGKVIHITGEAVLKRTASNITADDDIARSMARKRKCDIGKEEIHPCSECGKEFKRPCDLTKHQKTHSRPWKCSQIDCKYYELGWPTEKERDRHVNDKHSVDPPTFKCHFEGCAYTSKRESNCKQHMEKSHGWEYVRSKSKNTQKLANEMTPPTDINAPGTPLAPTPSSVPAYPTISTPMAPSPSNFTSASNSRAGSVIPGPSNYQQDFESSHLGFDKYASPIDYNAQGQNTFDFMSFDQGINAQTTPYTPALTDGHLDSFNSPSTDMSHPSPEYPVQPNSFEENFNVNEMSYETAAMMYPPVADFFPQYQVQQPMNAHDMDLFGNTYMDMDVTGGMTKNQTEQLFFNTPHSPFDATTYPAPSDDFTLFGEIPGGLPAEVNNLFPELAGQFDHGNLDVDMNDDLMEDYTEHDTFSH